ncbi:MAG: hypothetical protein IKJ00_00430, partial [Clostridia bacterium]|nr:hypothetical protein [Clostridia bacterium]
MKKFDISNIIISKICDVYSYTLPEDTESESVAAHSAIIIKRRGKSEYTVGAKKYVADKDNILFIPAGTKYSLYVYKAGDCAIIEFDG